ncbi:DNA polymerase II large subunit [Candidatus Woesearchaeota archaeon]|nr:MAG: DNA polymerase II large subunit [Candidatus Woesearchaeota archaeon]
MAYPAASPEMTAYFESLTQEVNALFKTASAARALGFDPAEKVEVALAENMAERVVGLISVIAPQIVGSGVSDRIQELEKQYGSLDWRVALKIAQEVAEQKFCAFKDQKEAMEVGIRTGFAYVTVGVVSSPLDGIVNIEIKDRMDKRGQYVCMNFAGPIRNAGGTAAAVAVIITDYVRKALGFDTYDCQENEVKRALTELQDYHERVTNLQYFPSASELEYLMQHIPVEVSGDPSEQIEVSNHKDLPRIPTNKIRSGYCLVLSSCIPLKAAKLWKQLSAWGKDFGMMDSWGFMEEFLHIQKKAKAGKSTETKSDAKIMPDYTYIADLVAGRPVLGYPLRPGGFRLRYGRSRTSGFSAQSIHPASMYILNQYIATGTQLKTERPGKAASMTSSDYLEGPIVLLEDGTVTQLKTLDDAKKAHRSVKEILFLGDTLIAYGDFLNRAHPLVPAGYCPEWWIQEVERATTPQTEGAPPLPVGIPPERWLQIQQNPLINFPTAHEAILIARATKTPLHPAYTDYWNLLTCDQLSELIPWLANGKIHTSEHGIEKIVLPKNHAKRSLELIGIPHTFVNNEYVIIDKEHATILCALFDLAGEKKTPSIDPAKTALENINALSPIQLRDKCGTFIGTRMGRPEKAKQRELTGSPHVLFPVGDEGGRLRSFQSALITGKVTANFALFHCEKCNAETVLARCEVCGSRTVQRYRCKVCGIKPDKTCPAHGDCEASTRKTIPIKHYFEHIQKHLDQKHLPELIKGVRGTMSGENIPEHLAKGIIRAKYGIHVYKDGTTRYDMTQLPLTHFKPIEVGTGIEKLRALGYTTDIHGKPLEHDTQVLELKPQDIVLPECDTSPEAGSGKVLLSIAQFCDDTLEQLYKQPRYYKAKNIHDLVGHLTIALAPHTSAGMIARIIGFSKTQGLFAHPLLHAATRRDCDGDEACVLLCLDAFLNFSKRYLPDSRGSTMDTPLVLTSILTPSEVDDMAFDVDVAWRYPLELYEAALAYKPAWEAKVPTIKKHLATPLQYEKMGFTHDSTNINHTVKCSAYKTLPSMQEKLFGQMNIAEKLRSVESSEVARLVIEKHFLKDTKGNLRKFSTQEFRCVGCNEKFRRPPLIGKCTECNGKIIFTISEGSVIKYLEPTISLAKKYNVSPYLQQTIELLKVRIEQVFGKDAEKQTGLGAWFG